MSEMRAKKCAMCAPHRGDRTCVARPRPRVRAACWLPRDRDREPRPATSGAASRLGAPACRRCRKVPSRKWGSRRHGVPPPRPSPRHAACVDKTRYMKTVYAVAVTATALTRCSERAHLSTLTHCTTQSQSLSPNSPLSSVLSIAKTASPPQHQPPWTMTARDTHLGRSSPLPYAAILCTRIHLARLC